MSRAVPALGLVSGAFNPHTGGRNLLARDPHRMADTLSPSHEELLRQHFPAGFAGSRRSRTPTEELVIDYGPLDSTHIVAVEEHLASGAAIGVKNSPLLAIRHTHHRLAQYLAMGMDETRAAKLCNYNPSRVSTLKSDPAFMELLAYYTREVKEEFADFVTSAKDLSMDFLGQLRDVLETKPETLTPSMLLESIKVLADRSGNAPTMKSVNVNVNADVGAKLDAARARLRNITPLDE